MNNACSLVHWRLENGRRATGLLLFFFSFFFLFFLSFLSFLFLSFYLFFSCSSFLYVLISTELIFFFFILVENFISNHFDMCHPCQLVHHYPPMHESGMPLGLTHVPSVISSSSRWNHTIMPSVTLLFVHLSRNM